MDAIGAEDGIEAPAASVDPVLANRHQRGARACSSLLEDAPAQTQEGPVSRRLRRARTGEKVLVRSFSRVSGPSSWEADEDGARGRSSGRIGHTFSPAAIPTSRASKHAPST